MSRKFDRYMVSIGAGGNRKFARFTDSERCAHFLGVLSIAAQSPVRGYLLISKNVEAREEEIAREACVSEAVARRAMAKLVDVGILERDEGMGAWYVHDWHELNPEPRSDRSNADRQRRFRERNGMSNAPRNAPVTHSVTPRNAPRNAPVTQRKLEEEVEVEVLANANTARKRAASKQANQNEIPAEVPAELHDAVRASLAVLCRVWEARGGLEPTLRGTALAVQAYPDREHVAIAEAVEHWLVAGRGRQVISVDVVARFRQFLSTTPPSKPGNVVPITAADDDWKRQLRAHLEGSA